MIQEKNHMEMHPLEFGKTTLALVMVLFLSTAHAQQQTCPPTCAKPGELGGPPPLPPPGAPGGTGGGGGTQKPGGPQQQLLMQQIMKPPNPSGMGGNPPGMGGNPPGMGGNPPGMGGNPPGMGGNPPGMGGNPPGMGGNPPGMGSNPPGVGGNPPGMGGNPPGTGEPRPVEQGGSDRGSTKGSRESNRIIAGGGRSVPDYAGLTNSSFVIPSGIVSRSFLSKSPLGNRY